MTIVTAIIDGSVFTEEVDMGATYICERCGKLIPRERRELLPETTTCVKCSDVKAKTDRDLPPEVSGVAVGELNWEDA